MAVKKAKSTDDGVLELARKRFDRVWTVEQDMRAEMLDDLKFRAGEQWPADVAAERKAADRPMLTINLMGKFVRQITGDIRLNKPSIKVRPADGGADVEMAKTFSGITRHIEQASDAQSAYVTAADGAANCGIGHFRILTQFSADDTFEQDIRIKRIRNPFAVYWDPGAEEITKFDATWCFVTERMQKEDFEDKWPKARSADFEAAGYPDDVTGWERDETVRVAEYWVKRPITKKLILLGDGKVIDVTGLKDNELEGLDIVRRRDVETHEIEWYKLSGAEILEGPMPWAGKFIPIVPVIGEEIHIGEREVRHGIVRFAKDPQRLYNYTRTTVAEAIGSAPKSPWVATAAQIEGNKPAWDNANKGNPSVLIYTPDPEAPGPPQRTQPAPMPVALFSQAQFASEDMNGTTGIFPPSLGAQSNETSGVAIRERKIEGDVGTFVYIDNLARSIRHGGDILVDLIPKIYDTERIVRILGEDDTEDFVTINEPVLDDTNQPVLDKDGNPKLVNDVSAGKYDVKVTTGPSFTTRRTESAASMMDFAKAVPEAAVAIGDLIAKNMDWPGSEVIAERLKKLLPPGLAEEDEDPDEEELAAREQEQQAAQQQQQLEQMAVELELAGKQAELAKIEAEIAKSQAQVFKTAAEAERTEAQTDGQQLDNATKAMELALQDGSLSGMLSQVVESEVARVLQESQPPAIVPIANPQ